MVEAKPGPFPVQFSSAPHPPEFQGPPPTEKEALLRRLVALLEEEAEVINQKVTSLYSTLWREQLWNRGKRWRFMVWMLGVVPGLQ